MSPSEILTQLINLGIVHKIEDEYVITNRVYRVLEELEIPRESSINVPKTIEINNLYPKEIREAAQSKKAEAILLYCKVPVLSKEGYLIHSFDGTSLNTLDAIIKNPEYDPTTLLEVIRDYYTFVDYPKGFGKFVRDGDLLTFYRWYKAGNKLGATGEKPDNTFWK